jgi:hypothetical protein
MPETQRWPEATRPLLELRNEKGEVVDQET